MPIYEFYCRQCNTLYNFLSRTIQPRATPDCPHCRQPSLERRLSTFATPGRAQAGDAAALPFDEAKMERAMSELAGQAESLNEEDPRQAAALMRKFTDATGMELGPSMQAALNRMEAGEDPEQIEADLGDSLENEEPFLTPGGRSRGSRGRMPPRRDPTLYEMGPAAPAHDPPPTARRKRRSP